MLNVRLLRLRFTLQSCGGPYQLLDVMVETDDTNTEVIAAWRDRVGAPNRRIWFSAERAGVDGNGAAHCAAD